MVRNLGIIKGSRNLGEEIKDCCMVIKEINLEERGGVAIS